MIRSMTAFARREAHTRWGVLSWEVRTVNHRFFDISLRLPEEFRTLEARIREAATSCVKRGKVDATLKFQPAAGGDADLVLNEDLVKSLLSLTGKIEGMMENPARTPSTDILKWPGVLQVVEHDADELQSEAMKLLGETLEEVSATRGREGAKLKALVAQRCDDIRGQVESVREQLPDIVDGQREKLRSRLADLKAELDHERLEQEIAFLAQKTDVNEELDRLGVHVDEVGRVLEQDGPVGRRLDFLMQELNREANTLGSKSVDAATTRASVEIKVSIEQMREQIQNIE